MIKRAIFILQLLHSVVPELFIKKLRCNKDLSHIRRPMNTESRTRSADSPKPASPRHGGQRSDHNGSISAQPHPSHTVTAPVERRRHQHSQPPSTALIGPMPRPPSPVQEQTRESRSVRSNPLTVLHCIFEAKSPIS